MVSINLDETTQEKDILQVNPDDFLPAIGQWTRLGSWCLLTIFAATLALISVIRYPEKVRAQAEVRPVGGTRVVEPEVSGTLKYNAVEERERVTVGQTIAFLDDQAIKSQIEQIEEGIAKIKVELTLSQQQIQATQTESAAEVEAIQKELDGARAEYSVFLKAEGAVSRNEINQRRQAVEILEARLLQTRATANRRSAETDQSYQVLEKQLMQDNIRLKQLQEDLSKTIVQSPINGVIQRLHIKNAGQAVNPGNPLAEIVPEDDPLVIEAIVPAKDINKVLVCPKNNIAENCEQGRVILRFENFLYPDYGVLRGAVRAKNPDGNVIQGSAGAEKAFKVIIEPEKDYVGNNPNNKIEAGFPVRADIITKDYTVLVFILRKIKVIVDEIR